RGANSSCNSASRGRYWPTSGHSVPTKTTTTAFRSLKSARETSLPSASLRVKASTRSAARDGGTAVSRAARPRGGKKRRKGKTFMGMLLSSKGHGSRLVYRVSERGRGKTTGEPVFFLLGEEPSGLNIRTGKGGRFSAFWSAASHRRFGPFLSPRLRQ